MMTPNEKNALLRPIQDGFDKVFAQLTALEERIKALENPVGANSTKESKKAA